MNNILDLAVFGGNPTFPEQLHVNRPNLGNLTSFERFMRTIMEDRVFTNNGPHVQLLSEKLAEYVGTEHCILTINGTSAMSLLIRALELKGEVILPSFTFISTAHTLHEQGIKPIFCDINPINWNIDLAHCESLISTSTSAIIATHLWGSPCNVDKLQDIALRHGIVLILDAAHAFGNSINGKKIGGFGTAEVFSLHATKALHTFEGGAITTDDQALANRLEKMRNFGFTDFDQVDLVGTNAKMTEICAAMGLANLQNIDQILRSTQKTYNRYMQNLERCPGVNLVNYDLSSQRNTQYIVLEIEHESGKLSRDDILQVLHGENTIARRYFYPGNHRMKPYASLFPDVNHELPITNAKCEKVLVLPGGSEISEKTVDQVCSLLTFIMKNNRQIYAALKTPEKTSFTAQTAVVNKEIQRHEELRQNTQPTLEIRLPISATQKYLRMVHYFLESLQLFGGPIAKNARCLVFVSRDQPMRDLAKECKWSENYDVEFKWLEDDLFKRYKYDATGFHRFHIESDADVIILADADILVAGNFDDAIQQAFRQNKTLGCIAHVSPFDTPKFNQESSLTWWSRIFAAARLPLPVFNNVHSGWGFMSKNKDHRTCPDYFNYGFMVLPTNHVKMIRKTFISDLNIVEQVLDTWFKSQIANTVSFVRHEIRCDTLSIDYNFPLHISDLKIRQYNPTLNRKDDASDIRIFHYLGKGRFNREDFVSVSSIENALARFEVSDSEHIFQNRLETVHSNIIH